MLHEMPLHSVTAPEFGGLLFLYDSLGDLAQDLSGGDDHVSVLSELWGFVKAFGQAQAGLQGYDAYLLPDDQGAPITVVESDGTIMPPVVWAGLLGESNNKPEPLAQYFGATV